MDFSQHTSTADLVAALSHSSAYPNEKTGGVELIETHISWVFLTDEHAYKVKKPVSNAFLDYSTLALRHRFCLEELRLDRRYAPELYLAVVPIACEQGQLIVGGTGDVRDYAVKMKRFPGEALLSQRLQDNLVQPAEIELLANTIASFHGSASRLSDSQYDGKDLLSEEESLELCGAAASIGRDATENFDAIHRVPNMSASDRRELLALESWTRAAYRNCEALFEQRRQTGCVRECHGDLHSGNVVWWNGQLTPFDGIEFSPRFRWIDVISDLAFLAMDLDLHKHTDLSNCLVSSYLEQTGDYQSVSLLDWYRVYRALVRAKVAGIVMGQHEESSALFRNASREQSQLFATAARYTHSGSPKLWITHGLSGSGKSTGAADMVRREGAIRIRADVERKRLCGKAADFRPNAQEVRELYAPDMTRRTYQRLHDLADLLLSAGFSVVVDATFLKRDQRGPFAKLAEERGLPFEILDFQADRQTLEQRLIQRQRDGGDASDADLAVLDLQFKALESLNDWERHHSQPVQPT